MHSSIRQRFNPIDWSTTKLETKLGINVYEAVCQQSMTGRIHGIYSSLFGFPLLGQDVWGKVHDRL